MKKAKRKQLAGMVYAMTNEAVNNQVIAFRRGLNGKLTRMKVYPTGGGGPAPQRFPRPPRRMELIRSRHKDPWFYPGIPDSFLPQMQAPTALAASGSLPAEL